MFITEEDYKVVVGETAFKTIAQADEANRIMAENEAMEEIACYLRPKYDCESIFAAEGDERNRQIVMYTCDIALYHMVSSMPQKMGSEIRKERYARNDTTAPSSGSKEYRQERLCQHCHSLTKKTATPQERVSSIVHNHN